MAASDDRGRTATSPLALPLKGWKDVCVRTWAEAGDDNVGLVAAGVAFYGFLALVPLLGAIVLSYGLVADPQTVVHNMQGLTSVMPADAAKLIGEQLMNVVTTSGTKKGAGVLLALALALFGARNGAGSVVTALNIAYEEKETRGFLRVNLLALAITAAAVLVAIVALVAIAALGHLDKAFPGAPAIVLAAGKLVTYGLLLLAGAAGAATLYRYGPSRRKARWTWITPGSAFAALLWLLLTLGFGIYVAKFGNYNATYGSLGAVVVLLTWLYLSSYVLLFGAELNSELEHQTVEDTTAGPARPLGTRDAWSADHVAGSDEPGLPLEPTLTARPSSTAIAAAASADRKPSLPVDLAVGRATATVGRVFGLRKAGMISSGAAPAGLAMLRTRGRATAGLALVALSAALAWASRDREEDD